MPVPVVDVRKVRVPVRQNAMPMWVHMRLAPVPRKVMLVLMVRVVSMRMRVLERLMRVFVFVPFANMQPDADTHQR
ncbi:hypothetical protein ASE08_12055 [Rhizobacter sp. Root16D2]|nr:hypothetical protein ASC88_15810 [Rhizobacter sp. Root29]KQW04538.1 hypothetical protein ASC98_05500 [Rhizobacter sp. Root1238]KRB06380.1 hypothetical protein ASE08_12055 [Rhizobacter sp. Root16D2]